MLRKHSAAINQIKLAIRTFRRLLKAAGEPFRKARRGRPFKRAPKRYALYLAIRAMFGWSLREAEAILALIFPRTDHLLADRGYDAEALYRLAYRKGWKICMKQRKPFESRFGLRGKVLSSFSLETYCAFRGRVESIFGGFANRYASLVRERLVPARSKASLWWCVAHNLRVLMRLQSALALIC